MSVGSGTTDVGNMPKMTRVKINCLGTPDKDETLKLLEIFFPMRFMSQDASLGMMDTQYSQTPKLIGIRSFGRTKLTQRNGASIPFMSPELNVKKSGILIKVDNVTYDRGEHEITGKLPLKNSWIQDELDFIYKFPILTTIKITLSQTSLAKKYTEKGLRAFNINIPPNEIKQEIFTPIRSQI